MKLVSDPEIDQWVSTNIDFPAIILLMFIMFGVWVLFQMQKRADFDLAQILCDPTTNKPSMFRVLGLGCFGISSWVIMYILFKNNGQIDKWLFGIYVLIFSGTPVASKAIDAYVSTKTSGLLAKDKDQS